MEKSYEEGCKLLELMDIDDVPLYHGAKDFIENRADLPTSEGSRFIIEEAMRECEEPLYIALLETLGFIVSSVLMLLSLLLFFSLEAKGKLRGKEMLKQVLICLLITVITVAVVYCLFSIALGVRLPAGIFK